MERPVSEQQGAGGGADVAAAVVGAPAEEQQEREQEKQQQQRVWQMRAPAGAEEEEHHEEKEEQAASRMAAPQQQQEQEQAPSPRRHHRRPFPLAGRTVVMAGADVTSATVGCARACAELGAARIVVAARSGRDARAAARQAIARRDEMQQEEAEEHGAAASAALDALPCLEACCPPQPLDLASQESVKAFALWAREGSFAATGAGLEPGAMTAAAPAAIDVLVLMPPASSSSSSSAPPPPRRAYEPRSGASAQALRVYSGPRLLCSLLRPALRRAAALQEQEGKQEREEAPAPVGAAEGEGEEEEEEEQQQAATHHHDHGPLPTARPHYPRVVVATTAHHRLSSAPPAAPFFSEWLRGTAAPSAAAAQALLAAELRARLVADGIAVALCEVPAAGRVSAAAAGAAAGAAVALAAVGRREEQDKGGATLPLAMPPLLRPLQELAASLPWRRHQADVSALAAAVCSADLRPAREASGGSGLLLLLPHLPHLPLIGAHHHHPHHPSAPHHEHHPQLDCFVAGPARAWAARAGRLAASAVGWLPVVGGSAAWAAEAAACGAGLAAEMVLGQGGEGDNVHVVPAGGCAADAEAARAMWAVSRALEREAGAAEAVATTAVA